MMARWYASAAATVIALIAPGIAHAQHETRASVDVSPGVGYSSNPFAVAGDNTGSAYADVNIAPRIQLLTPKSTLTLSGDVSLQKYFSHYSSTDSYRIGLNYSGRPSARLQTHMRVDLSSAIIGAYNTLDNGVIEPGLPVPSDYALFGSRDRRRSLYASGGFDLALSERDSISVNGFYELARYRLYADTSDYNGYGGTIAYSRQISANTRIGLQGGVSRYDYRGARGSTEVYSISPTISTKLGRLWTLDGAVGVSFVNGSSIGSTRAASLSGNANLCRNGELSTFCVNAARQVRPTGLDGSQYVNTVGANWSRKLSPYTTISAYGSYSTQSGTQLPEFSGLNVRYLTGGVAYERRLTERLRLIASGRYRKIFSDSYNRSDDIGGRIGVTYRFGDPR